MSYSYNTLPRVEKEAASPNVFAVVACCVALGAAVGVISSSTSNLYSAVGTRPVVQNTIPTPYSSRTLSSRAEAVISRAGPNAAVPEPSVQNSSIGAVAGGCIIAAAAALGAFAGRVFQSAKATWSDPLGLSKYQEAEERWSMMAATAFVGTKAPDFTATAVFDEEFVEVKLSQYKGKNYVVLFFYPLDFTFVCPTEITAFSDRAAEFEALGTQILGVSVDSQFSHLAWIQTPRNQGGLGELKYPLVADLKKEIAESYGVLTEDGIALRGLFIIDKEGIIQHATINNLAFGRNVDETLRVLEALQHVQANPDEVCPAGWKKGDKTMKPDPVGSKEYFSAI